MRHAKAESGVPGQRDFDRSLSARGRDDAARMGRLLAKLRSVPDAIVASPAARAKETAEAVGVSPATVKRQWAVARAWLKRSLMGPAPEAEDVREG